MDLSKAFDCLPHDLIIAKLHVYGLDHDSVRLIRSYLSNRHQRMKLDSGFSLWYQTIIEVAQGSILGPLLFNIFLNDLLPINLRSVFCNFYWSQHTLLLRKNNRKSLKKFTIRPKKYVQTVYEQSNDGKSWEISNICCLVNTSL